MNGILRKAEDHRAMARWLARILESYPLTASYREELKRRRDDHARKARRRREVYYSQLARS